jgi:hypothetical protein
MVDTGLSELRVVLLQPKIINRYFRGYLGERTIVRIGKHLMKGSPVFRGGQLQIGL